MKMFFSILVFILWITKSAAFLRRPVDIVYEYRDEILVNLNEGIRTRRSIDNGSHPQSYDLDLVVDGSDVHLHLTRNDHLITNVPTLSLKQGLLTKLYLAEQEDSIFYQDVKNGASFVVQKDKSQQNMFGTFHSGSNNYVLQNTNLTSPSMSSGPSRFEIVKENKTSIQNFDGISVGGDQSLSRGVRHRRRRATGSNKIELLVVCDFAIYKYWYDQSDKSTSTEKESDAVNSVRQYYAFVINGMDAMYKNIQTSSYTISVVYAGLTIAKTPLDSAWTENIKYSSGYVDSTQGLNNFRTWIRQNTQSLPERDHAMLFSRYDLTSNGSPGNAGLAWSGAICTDSSQSIVEDRFDFIMITTAAHELGHSLNAEHDGSGNGCPASQSYIMSPSNSPQKGSTATHPWIFSTCSTSYFTNKINSLELTNQNCMKTLSANFNPSGLSPYDKRLAGQVFYPDAQCKHIYGNSSYMCMSLYNNDYSSICNILWCHNSVDGLCHSAVAGTGTVCGNKKWCVSGSCTYDAKAPSGNDNCLYGDVKGQIYSNGWTCADMVRLQPHNCQNAQEQCCASCNPNSPTTTTSTQSPITNSQTTTTSTQSPITNSPTTLSPITSESTTTESSTSLDVEKFIFIGVGVGVVGLVILSVCIVCIVCRGNSSNKNKYKNGKQIPKKNLPNAIRGYDNPAMAQHLRDIRNAKY